MKRALIDRAENVTNLPNNYTKTFPNLLQSNLIFKDSKLAKTNSYEEFSDNENDSENLKASSNCKLLLNYGLFIN